MAIVRISNIALISSTETTIQILIQVPGAAREIKKIKI